MQYTHDYPDRFAGLLGDSRAVEHTLARCKADWETYNAAEDGIGISPHVKAARADTTLSTTFVGDVFNALAATAFGNVPAEALSASQSVHQPPYIYTHIYIYIYIYIDS